MISNTHYVELYINNELIELESQSSLHMRINNVLFNPTKASTTQAEYSYTFDIPSTPNNDRILGYANNLSKTNKFHARYPSQVYADGSLLFDGSLTIQKYDAKDKMYSCNLVNIKINTLDEIFGDDKLTDVKWMVDFDGVDTINSVNADSTSKFWFPLVSYGAFIKDYVSKDEVSTEYTSKYDIDKWNRFYISDFYPSLNVMEEIKKCFEWKGYNVAGDALYDPIISNIYASTNLGSDQVPSYNLGNPKFGKLDIHVSWSNETAIGAQEDPYMIIQELEFPYFPCSAKTGTDEEGNDEVKTEWNYDNINVWSIFNVPNINIDFKQPTSLFTYNDDYRQAGGDNRHANVIRIPKSGWYKIHMSGWTQCMMDCGSGNTPSMGTSVSFDEWHISGGVRLVQKNKRRASLHEFCPVDVYLVRNYDPNDNPIELIKGSSNMRYKNGNSVSAYTTGMNTSQGHVSYTYSGNCVTWATCYPHEQLFNADAPTKTDKFLNYGITSDNKIGYVKKESQNAVMGYDPAVSKSFICGYSTFISNTMAVIKDGISWYKADEAENNVFANVDPYDFYTRQVDESGKTIGYNTEATNYNKNTFQYAPNNSISTSAHKNYPASDSTTDNRVNCELSCCVWLEEGDKLEMLCIERSYDYGRRWWYDGYYHYYSEEDTLQPEKLYNAYGEFDLQIEAISDENKALLVSKGYNYNTPTAYPTQLNLMNFTNEEKKVSDWIKSVTDALNLSLEMNGNNVLISTNKGVKKDINNAVDIDDRVNSHDATSEYISYPREMSVKYKIDTEEHGFYDSVPPEHLNSSDWKDWGDSGFTVIQLNDDSYETSTQNKSTQFSYCWYDNFQRLWDNDSVAGTIQLPVISKEEYMIDGYKYDEAMEHRGYGLTQRFWFRTFDYKLSSNNALPVYDDVIYVQSPYSVKPKKVLIYTPVNQQDGFNLSYKDTETSMVTEYFNIHPMLSSNYVKVDVFLNPEEYIQIKGGALVHFDSDLYYTSEISGYDPSGNNTTTLKLIKKV